MNNLENTWNNKIAPGIMNGFNYAGQEVSKGMSALGNIKNSMARKMSAPKRLAPKPPQQPQQLAPSGIPKGNAFVGPGAYLY